MSVHPLIQKQTAPDYPTHSATSVRQVPVDRDENGEWTHPQFPNIDEGATSLEITQALIALGLEYNICEMEDDAPQEVLDSWMEFGIADCSKWEPSRPAGEGWFTFSIHESANGPVCIWARPKPKATVALDNVQIQEAFEQLRTSLQNLRMAASNTKGYWMGSAISRTSTLHCLGLIADEQADRVFELISNASEHAGQPFPTASRKEAF